MSSIIDGRTPLAAVIVAVALAGSGCVLAPKGIEDERADLRAAGPTFELEAGERRLPELSPQPDWQEVLRLAFLSNGDLEAAYFEWKAAVARVAVEAAYPNTNVSLGFQYLFSRESMKAWDRTTLSVGFDPMQNLSFPSKVVASGRVALEAARAAGKRFAAAKFELQRQVLTAYAEYALLAEKIRLQRELVALRRVVVESARGRLAAGGVQRDLVEAEMELRLAENDLANLEAEIPERRAALNALIGRDPTLALRPPGDLPAPRAIGVDDATLLMVAVDDNPELAALAHEVAGREDALELARLQYIPDINPFAGFRGGIEQVVGAAVSVPANIPRIRGMVREAEATLQRAEATSRQARLDRAARFVGTLYAVRNRERQAALFASEILPAAEAIATNVRQSYVTGGTGLADLVEAESAVLEVRRALAEAQTVREQRLADLEALAGVDIEAFSRRTAGAEASYSAAVRPEGAPRP
jgi:outer membrane protein TolC